MKDQSKWDINLEKVYCPKCNELLPPLRVPKDKDELLWGGWTCKNCGCKVDKFGKSVRKKNKQAFPD